MDFRAIVGRCSSRFEVRTVNLIFMNHREPPKQCDLYLKNNKLNIR